MPHRVDAYGDPLPSFALARLGTIRWRHRGMIVEDVVYARDGRTLYCASGGITAIDLATGLARWSVSAGGSQFVALLAHPEGDVVVAAGGVEVAMFDAATGAPRGVFSLPSRMLCTVAASHDGRTVFAGGFDRFGALLERDGTVRARLRADDGMYLQSASFSPDDASVVTTDCRGGVVQWAVDDGRRLRVFGEAELSPTDAVFTPDGARLVVALSDGDVRVYDVATGALLSRWKAYASSVYGVVVVTPDGQRIVTCSDDRALALWRLDDGARLATRLFSRNSTALCLSPDGATVACSEGPRVVQIDLATFTERTPSTEHAVTVQALALSADGETLATIVGLNEVRGWSMSTYEPIFTLPLAAYVFGVRALPEPDRFALLQNGDEGTAVLDLTARTLSPRESSDREALQRWWGRGVEATIGSGVLSLRNDRGAQHTLKTVVHSLAFTPDDRHAVFLERGRVTRWDLETHTAGWVVSVRQAAEAVMSPRGDEVAVWTPTSVRRLSLADGATRSTWKIPQVVNAAAYSPDGARLAVATYADVRVFDCATGREIARLEGHGALVATLHFDRDGARLVTGSWDSTALVWSLDEAIAGYAQTLPAKPARRGRKAQ